MPGVGVEIGLGGSGGKGGGSAPTPDPLAITGTPDTTADVGAPYAFTAAPAATGGQGVRTFRQVGTWPAGVAINPATGALSGLPTEAGVYTGLSVGVEDAAGGYAELDAFTLTVTLPLPVWRDLPAISDLTPTEGQTITATAGLAEFGVTSYTYRWLTDDSPVTAIPGAVNRDFLVDATTVGGPLFFEAKATNATGTTTVIVGPTSNVAAAVPDPPANTVLPAVSVVGGGAAVPGATLQGTTGTWTNVPTVFNRQWRRDGVSIPQATAATYVLTLADAGKTITQFVEARNSGPAGGAAISNGVACASLYPVVTVEPGVGRPIGLWTDAGAAALEGWSPVYDPVAHPPVDALYLSAYAGNITNAVAAARTAGRDLKIDMDFNWPTGSFGRSNVKLWGIPVSGRMPKATATGVTFPPVNDQACAMYGVNGDCFARGIEFIGFGTVFGIALPSVYNPIYKHPVSGRTLVSGGSSAVTRGVPAGVGPLPSSTKSGVGVAWSGTPTAIDAVPGGTSCGITFNITDCKFTDCQQVGIMVSDSFHAAPVIFQRNVLDGTHAGLDLQSSVPPDGYIYCNEWKNCTLRDTGNSRRQNNNGSSGLHTFIKWGIDAPDHRDVRTHTFKFENNYCYAIEDTGVTSDVNSAVAVDFRNANPASFTGYTGPASSLTAQCSVSISYNHFERLNSVSGQIDCNPIYLKALGYLIEMNRFLECGGWDLNPDGNQVDPATGKRITKRGSEGYIIVQKNPGSWPSKAAMAAKFCAIRFNYIYKPPAVLVSHTGTVNGESIGPEAGGFTVKVDTNRMATYIEQNFFEDVTQIAAGTLGVIRPTATSTNQFQNGCYVRDNWFVNCRLENGGVAVRMHEASSTQSGSTDGGTSGQISGNKLFDKVGGDFAYNGVKSLIVKNNSTQSVSNNTVTTRDPAVSAAAATWSAQGGTSPPTARLDVPSLPAGGTPSTVKHLTRGATERVYKAGA